MHNRQGSRNGEGRRLLGCDNIVQRSNSTSSVVDKRLRRPPVHVRNRWSLGARQNERTNGGRAGEGETSHSKGGFQSKASFSRSAIRSRRRPIRRVPRPVSFRNCSPYSVDTLDSNSQLDIHVYRSRRRPTSRHQHRLVSSNGRG